MVSLTKEVYEGLNGLGGCQAFYFYPESWNRFPVISYYEANNSDGAQADGAEYLTDLAYVIDVWGKDPLQNNDIAGLIDTALCGLGLKREFSRDMREGQDEEILHHKTMRYVGVAKQNGTIYQRI